MKLAKLKPGRHRFSVVATSASGAAGEPATTGSRSPASPAAASFFFTLKLKVAGVGSAPHRSTASTEKTCFPGLTL